jgi:hypothetical protein
MRLSISMLDARPLAASDAGIMKARISSRRPRGLGAILHYRGALKEPAGNLEYRSMRHRAPSPFEAQFGDAVCERYVLRENGDMRQNR